MNHDYPGSKFDSVWRNLTFPAKYANPAPQRRYHLIVIGAGTAGLISAIGAAGLGAKVALVEREAMGGDCLNVGCVPSKALLEYTRRHDAPVDFDDAFRWLRKIRSEIAAHDSVERYTENGVDVFLGNAMLENDQTVVVGDRTLTARRILIATGARATLPAIPGIEDCEPLTNDSLFDLKSPPSRLIILGAGAIGCEMAQAFAKLGTDVNLVEIAERILPLEEDDASAAVAEALLEAGVTIHTGSAVTAVSTQDSTISVHMQEPPVTADRLLVAAGRRANIDGLALATAGVETENGLIKVDKRMRTTNRRIFAAGDVCSSRQFTHNADAQARIVVQNALFAPTASSAKLVIPHCTYTRPEVAQVGNLRRELEEQGTAYDVYRVELNELDRSRIADDTKGFVEVITRKGRDHILGATIVAHDAGEQIASLCLAMTHKIGLGEIGKVVLPYPTRSEYLRQLSNAYNRTRLTPRAKRLMTHWFRWSA